MRTIDYKQKPDSNEEKCQNFLFFLLHLLSTSQFLTAFVEINIVSLANESAILKVHCLLKQHDQKHLKQTQKGYYNIKIF